MTIRLDFTASDLEHLQAVAFASSIRYGRHIRRAVAREYAELGETALERRAGRVSVVPDAVLAPGEYEAIKARRFVVTNLWP